MIIFLVLLIVICVMAEGFFSGSELAVVSVDRALLEYKIQNGSKAAFILQKMYEKPELLLGTTLLGTNATTVTANFAANELFSRLFGADKSAFSMCLIVPLVLLFGEILPKAYFRKNAATLAFKVIPILRILSLILSPIIMFYSSLGLGLRKILSGKKDIRIPIITRSEFRMLLDQERLSASTDKTLRMLSNISSYMEKTVEDIAIAMVNVTHCAPTNSFRQAVETLRQSGYSRLPVYDSKKDCIIGFITDLMLANPKNRNKPAKKIAQNPLFVPENLSLSKALIRLRAEQCEMAAVIDEYGGTVGIVALKDIVKEITGKLGDQYETDPRAYIQRISKDIFIVDALFGLDKLARETGEDFGHFSSETLGGLINHLSGRILQKGERCRYENLVFEIIRARPQKIEMVKIKKQKKENLQNRNE